MELPALNAVLIGLLILKIIAFLFQHYAKHIKVLLAQVASLGMI
jgi:hypothetical protein